MTPPLEWEQPERCPYAHRGSESALLVQKTGTIDTSEINLEVWLCSEGHEFFIEALA